MKSCYWMSYHTSKKTTNPEVIHKDFWFSPAASQHGLSTGEEARRW